MADTHDAACSIEIRNVTKRFGSVVALDQVSLDIRASELFFLLGPSGCGKTTLLRILAGLESPDSGDILFNGRSILDLPPHRRGAPMVFQNYALWPHLNVAQNVAFGLVERRVPRREIAGQVSDVLKRVGLGGMETRTPSQLSGGQQQRVVLARALVLNPSVVLLDEPLSNLDAKLRAEMRDEIGQLHAGTHITFVYVTHDQVEALSLADRMALLRAGRIEAIGAPKDLYYRPPNAFTAEFLGEANMIPGSVVSSSAGRVRVQTEFGTWEATAPAGVPQATGAAVLCLTRPENLRPVVAGSGEGNTLEAEIRTLRMTGSTISVGLKAAATALRATVLNAHGLELRPGQTLRWQAAAQDTVIVPQG